MEVIEAVSRLFQLALIVPWSRESGSWPRAWALGRADGGAAGQGGSGSAEGRVEGLLGLEGRRLLDPVSGH